MIDDRTIAVGKKEYQYADWSVGVLRKVLPLFEVLAETSIVDVTEHLRINAQILSHAMMRDYPELTEDFINTWLTMDQSERASQLGTIQIDKFIKKNMPETLTQETSQSIGTESTQDLSPPQDGVGNT